MSVAAGRRKFTWIVLLSTTSGHRRQVVGYSQEIMTELRLRKSLSTSGVPYSADNPQLLTKDAVTCMSGPEALTYHHRATGCSLSDGQSCYCDQELT